MKYDVKGNWRRLFKSPMRVVLALVVLALLLIPVAVQADLKIVRAVDAWDFPQARWENGNVVIPWDGGRVPFVPELNFDSQILEDPAVCGYDPNITDSGTEWAGTFYYGLYHVDNAPLGAPGFQESRQWSLVDCAMYDTTDPFDRASYFITECEPPDGTNDWCVVELADQDVEVACSTGNCEWEIVTTVKVNLDLDCNHVIDPGLGAVPPALCFYAQARTPTPDQVAAEGMWAQTLQARVSQGQEEATGDRTVSFDHTGVTAVELAAFDAAPQDNGVLLTWETASEVDNLGFNIYRADAQVGALIKINPNLIPAKNLGSSMGAAYSFLDDSAVPGATYYYWLEDLDMSGASAKHGPVIVQASAAKALPGRPRPAPMPGNAY